MCFYKGQCAAMCYLIDYFLNLDMVCRQRQTIFSFRIKETKNNLLRQNFVLEKVKKSAASIFELSSRSLALHLSDFEIILRGKVTALHASSYFDRLYLWKMSHWSYRSQKRLSRLSLVFYCGRAVSTCTFKWSICYDDKQHSCENWTFMSRSNSTFIPKLEETAYVILKGKSQAMFPKATTTTVYARGQKNEMIAPWFRSSGDICHHYSGMGFKSSGSV